MCPCGEASVSLRRHGTGENAISAVPPCRKGTVHLLDCQMIGRHWAMWQRSTGSIFRVYIRPTSCMNGNTLSIPSMIGDGPETRRKRPFGTRASLGHSSVQLLRKES
jgi:hypothetical protein